LRFKRNGFGPQFVEHGHDNHPLHREDLRAWFHSSFATKGLAQEAQIPLFAMPC
jgi:hypothetical protein